MRRPLVRSDAGASRTGNGAWGGRVRNWPIGCPTGLEIKR
jgi:hypothetical protein